MKREGDGGRERWRIEYNIDGRNDEKLYGKEYIVSEVQGAFHQ